MVILLDFHISYKIATIIFGATWGLGWKKIWNYTTLLFYLPYETKFFSWFHPIGQNIWDVLKKSTYHASIVHGFFTLENRLRHFLTAIFGHLTSLMKKSIAFLWSVQSYLQSEMFLSNSVDVMKYLHPAGSWELFQIL